MKTGVAIQTSNYDRDNVHELTRINTDYFLDTD
jgi:hypothetical protein